MNCAGNSAPTGIIFTSHLPPTNHVDLRPKSNNEVHNEGRQIQETTGTSAFIQRGGSYGSPPKTELDVSLHRGNCRRLHWLVRQIVAGLWHRLGRPGVAECSFGKHSVATKAKVTHSRLKEILVPKGNWHENVSNDRTMDERDRGQAAGLAPLLGVAVPLLCLFGCAVLLELDTPPNRRLVGESATGHTILKESPCTCNLNDTQAKIV